MKRMVLGLALAIGAFALIGCGNDKNEMGYGYYPGQQGGGIPPIQGYCAPEVVTAYNNFQTQCSYQQGSNMNFQPCRFASEHFLRLYPEISCVVVPPGQGNFNGFNNGPYSQYYPNYQGQQVFHITSFPMRDMLRFLDQMGVGGNNGGNWQQFPRWPYVGSPYGNNNGGYGNGAPYGNNNGCGNNRGGCRR